MAGNPLDNPVWQALTGPHAGLATQHGLIRRYPPEIAPFAGMAEPSTAAVAGLPATIPAEGIVAIVGVAPIPIPQGTEPALAAEVLQMAATAFVPYPRQVDFVPLTAADVPAMLALVELTHPGPFGPRTIEMGRYIGVKSDGALVAMAGERMRLDGFTEVSAVCVHPDYRGKGYAKALVSAIATGIVAAGSVPFLHVYPDNQPAIATYEALGFRPRRLLHFTVLKQAA